MRLLIITQKVDKNDGILGFFHGWLLEFAKNVEKLTVICLYEGTHSLPSNVEVLSLGKNEDVGKIVYLKRFFSYIWKKRNDYEKVFIHMNPEYLVLGGLLWKILQKDVYLWFNHPRGNIWVWLMHTFPKNIFCTSKYAFVKKYKKTILMPAGIDTSIFKNQNLERKKNSILILGRISPIKRLHILDPALRLLRDAPFDLNVSVYGEAPLQDVNYAHTWKDSIKDLIASRAITLKGNISNNETPRIYNKYKMYINLTPSGSFDKTILESMSCGVLPIVANKSFEGILPKENIFIEDDSVDLADKIKMQFNRPQHEYERLSHKLVLYVERKQSIHTLVKKLMKVLEIR